MRFDLFAILFISVAFTSCSTESSTKLDLTQFDYLKSIEFNQNFKEHQKVLPNNFKVIESMPEFTRIGFEQNDLQHEINFEFFNDELFFSATATIDFTKRIQDLEIVFEYIEQLTKSKYGAPYFKETFAGETQVNWHVDPFETELNRHVSLRKSDKYITLIWEQFNAFDGLEYDWIY